MLLLKISVNTIEIGKNDFHARLVRKCIERTSHLFRTNFIETYYIQTYSLTSPLTSEEITILTTLQERGVISSYTVEEAVNEDDIA